MTRSLRKKIKALLGQRAVNALARWARRGPSDKEILWGQLRRLGYDNHASFFESGEENFIDVLAASGHSEFAVDVGANEGKFAQMLGTKGLSRAVLIEPHSAHQPSLSRVARSFGYKDRQTALSDEPGTGELRFDPDLLFLASLSTEVEQIPYVTNRSSEAVDLSTLDALCEELDWPEIDLLKIDVEGWEHEVLTGAQLLFRRRPPCFIQIEINWHQLLRGHSLLSLSRLIPDGYQCFQLLSQRQGARRVNVMDPLSNFFWFSNFVFVRPDKVEVMSGSRGL